MNGWPSTFLSLLCLIPCADAFSFQFTGTPTQCANMTVQWTNGNPPYKLLVVPIGHLNPETRVIMDQGIQSGNAFSWTLRLPADSSFVAVMSDNSGIGAGGTSTVTKVASSDDKSCLSTTPSSPKFLLFTDPSTPQQCRPMEISYNQGAQPPVDILGIIPGGDTFEAAKGAPSNSSFDWTANVKGGTQILFVAGDTTGVGTGGSTDLLTVRNGDDSSCLASDSPSSTSGNPAGGVSTAAPSAQPGSTESFGNGGSTVYGPLGGPSSSIGPGPGLTSADESKTFIIIGAVIGSVVLLTIFTLAFLVFIRQRRSLIDRDPQYGDTDPLRSNSPPPSLYHVELLSPPASPIVSPASDTALSQAGRNPALMGQASSGTRSARGEFPHSTLGEGRRPEMREGVEFGGVRGRGYDGLRDEERRSAVSHASGVEDRGYAESAASVMVEIPPAYDSIIWRR